MMKVVGSACVSSVVVVGACVMLDADEERGLNKVKPAVSILFISFPQVLPRDLDAGNASPNVGAHLVPGTASTAPSPHGNHELQLATLASRRPDAQIHPLQANRQLQKILAESLSGQGTLHGTLEPNSEWWPKSLMPKLGRASTGLITARPCWH